MTAAGTLRPPSPLDPTVRAYKDWLHLNLFDHASGTVGLVNASLHGAPDEASSRAGGTALLHLPDEGWVGNVEAIGFDEANVGAASVALEHVAVAVAGGRGEVLASAHFPDDGLRVDAVATPGARPIDVELRVPLGPGWISWSLVPALSLAGTVEAAGRTLDLGGARAYHDHNWGRWHWGDDLGWEWGCFLPPAPGPVFVVSRTTDRSHRIAGRPLLVVQRGTRRRSFRGRTIEIVYEGRLAAEPRRLPGGLAALHQDRAVPRLPARVLVRADDGGDFVTIDFRARAAAQLIAADPARHGYGFVHELVGGFEYACRLDCEAHEGTGLAVMEHVD